MESPLSSNSIILKNTQQDEKSYCYFAFLPVNSKF